MSEYQITPQQIVDYGAYLRRQEREGSTIENRRETVLRNLHGRVECMWRGEYKLLLQYTIGSYIAAEEKDYGTMMSAPSVYPHFGMDRRGAVCGAAAIFSNPSLWQSDYRAVCRSNRVWRSPARGVSRDSRFACRRILRV